MGDDVSFKELSELTTGFTGADLGGLVREASLQALKESLLSSNMESTEEAGDEEQLFVGKKHFLEALANIKPSVSDEVRFQLIVVGLILINYHSHSRTRRITSGYRSCMARRVQQIEN